MQPHKTINLQGEWLWSPSENSMLDSKNHPYGKRFWKSKPKFNVGFLIHIWGMRLWGPNEKSTLGSTNQPYGRDFWSPRWKFNARYEVPPEEISKLCRNLIASNWHHQSLNYSSFDVHKPYMSNPMSEPASELTQANSKNEWTTLNPQYCDWERWHSLHCHPQQCKMDHFCKSERSDSA